MKHTSRLLGIALPLIIGAFSVQGQTSRALAANVIVPQTRVVPIERTEAVRITGVKAEVEIVGQVATTVFEVHLHNPGARRLEAELLVPVPDGVVVRGFTFAGAGPEGTAELLPKEEARRIYDSIVAKIRDPALLEFVGYNLVRSSVFPVEAGKEQWVRLTYEHLLTVDGNRVDYVLPRSESLAYDVPWEVTVEVKSKRPIATLYSPSHEVTIERHGAKRASVRIVDTARRAPGAFRLSYLIEGDGVAASLMAYPDPKIGGGYFLLLAGLPAKPLPESEERRIKREVTLVFDRSGSMNGEKIEQVHAAALQLLAGLEDGEAFNVMVYNEAVDLFSERPVLKTPDTMRAARDYVNSVKARGGTNIHDALVEALRQPPTADMLPIVLFLTDGLPTIGRTSEADILEAVEKGNPHRRRVFTFGVGVDVNTPLLSAIASDTRATTTFVLPKEDVEVKVARVFERLAGPVLAYPELERDSRRTHDLLPSELPDLFNGDQLVVLGQYIGEAPLAFTLAGNYLGEKGRFEFTFSLDKATTRNAFVPRLWASRKIGVLLEAIRKLGGNGHPSTGPSRIDPRMKELVDEVVRLSTEFGILTEYTAFLARDGADLGDHARAVEEAGVFFGERNALRSGLGAANQESNIWFMKGQKSLNISNEAFDAEMKRGALSRRRTAGVAGAAPQLDGVLQAPGKGAGVAVQQVNDLAFYWKGSRWVDSRIVGKPGGAQPAKVINFGSPEFMDLVRHLAQQNRQGSIALRGDILMEVDGEVVLIKGP